VHLKVKAIVQEVPGSADRVRETKR
jgi:hypothetical protein